MLRQSEERLLARYLGGGHGTGGTVLGGHSVIYL